ncbi:hypothetical protein EOD39_18772 [Acipenser ruthenus]|uniref:Uncharacterized protein n=1 Tax=Acipenser ruthenus TaxID=7906 RepID=A0A444V046_ACIRT|nr:hypothetical protein EOD39_18772 [Acipenser ruthenus]
MSGFHRCVTCEAKLPANDPHEDCVACLGPDHAASALADRTFCALCVNFQMRTLCQRARKVVGGHSPSSGSSHTLSALPLSSVTLPVKLWLSRSPSSQLTAGQRSPDTRRARERSPIARLCSREVPPLAGNTPAGPQDPVPGHLAEEDVLVLLVETIDTGKG